MESAIVQSSPTVRSSRLSLRPVSSLDLRDTLLSMAMADDSLHAAIVRHEVDSAEAGFFDLSVPIPIAKEVGIEHVMKRLFSKEHLHFILADHVLFYRFSSFLNRFKPHIVPTLVRYLEMRKAMKAIEYANAVARSIRWPSHTDYCKFSKVQAAVTDVRFEDYATRELMLLCAEALPAFITHSLVGVITECVSKEITGQVIPVLQDLVGNLAEVFCLTDPSVQDNPIIYASEEFHKTTQYGTSYAINRNCRFLQGPSTDRDCTLRIAKAISLGQESNEIILNYRRDGTPFANLLMCAPLYDDKGIVRYFIGAQIDVTGLVMEGLGVESFRALLHKDEQKENELEVTPHNRKLWQTTIGRVKDTHKKLQELSTMFSQDESDIVGKNIRGGDDSSDSGSVKSGVPTSVKNRGQPRRVIDEVGDPLAGLANLMIPSGHPVNCNLPGVYKHYLLVRPYPSLQIIFVSPTLRLPGLLRTHLFSKIGGPAHTIASLESAFRDGASVTARVLWLPKNSQAGERGRPPPDPRPRYIRCTPLLGSDDRVGVWMIILVPAEEPNSFMGYGRHNHGIVDDMVDDRRRYETATPRSTSRSTSVTSLRIKQSLEADFDGGFGLKRRGVNTTPVRMGRGDDDTQLYAEYLRSSSSTSSSIEGLAKTRNDSVVLDTRDQETTAAIGRRSKDSSSTEMKVDSMRRRHGIGTSSRDEMPHTRIDGSPIREA